MIYGEIWPGHHLLILMNFRQNPFSRTQGQTSQAFPQHTHTYPYKGTFVCATHCHITQLRSHTHVHTLAKCMAVYQKVALTHTAGVRGRYWEQQTYSVSLCVFLLRWIIYAALSPKVVILLHHSLIYTSNFCSDLNRNAAYSCFSSLFFYKPNPFNLSCYFFQSSLHKGTKNAITSQLFLLVGKVIKRRAHGNFLLRRKAPVISHGSLHKFQKMYQIALRFAKIQKSVIKIRDDDLTKHF